MPPWRLADEKGRFFSSARPLRKQHNPPFTASYLLDGYDRDSYKILYPESATCVIGIFYFSPPKNSMRFCYQETDQSAQMTDWAQQAGWDLCYDQAEAGHFHANRHVASSPQLKIFLDTFNLELRIHGTVPSGCFALTMLNRGGFHGAERTDDHSLCLTGPGEAIILRTPAGHHLDAFLIRADFLQRLISEGGNHVGMHPRTISTGLISPMSPHRQLLRLRARELVRHAAQSGRINRQSYRDAKLAFIAELSQTLQVMMKGSPPPSSCEFHHVAHTCELIRKNLHHTFSLEEMCKHAGVGPRTLQTSFRQILGISPIRFARESRLNAVQLRLTRARGEETLVKALAIEHGFFHAGHFWEEYHALFGESPSTTLART